MFVINKSAINAYSDDDHSEALVEGQTKADKNYDILKDPVSIPVGYTYSSSVCKWGAVDPRNNSRQG